MNEEIINPEAKYFFQAFHLMETLKLKDISKLFYDKVCAQTANKLIYEEKKDGYFFIYRFGTVVFFNVDQEKRKNIIDRIFALIGEKPEMIISDEYAVEVKQHGKNEIGFENATLDKVALNRIEIIAFILAQSTTLEYFEKKVDERLAKSGVIGNSLKTRGRLALRSHDIKKFIGECITTKQELVTSLYLLDKPEETWENQTLDKLYQEAHEMFEIRARYKTVDYKLRMIQEDLELIADLLQHRYAIALEWTVVLLIAAEIVIFIWDILK